MACILNDGRLTLSGDVGDFYFGDHFTYSDVLLALAQVDADSTLDVHINSGGGYATEGAAIHALFAGRTGITNFVVEGIAASAASLIVMAGDVVTMSAGAVLMIHDPASWTFGTVDDHAKTVEGLEALATAYARVYALKSGKSEDECRAIMKAERWFAPDEAVAEGFADDAGTGKGEPVAAFDYRTYGHAPPKLAALAKRKNWSMAQAKAKRAPTSTGAPTASASTQPQNQEPPVADNTNGGQAPDNASAIATAVAADRQRRREIMALDEARGREDLAGYFADETDDPVEKVKAALSRSPKNGGQGGAGTNGGGAPAMSSTQQHAQRRLNGEGLNGSDGPTAQRGDRAILSAAADARNKRR
ncbi:head maturation protease, ClpP-related [Aureimonas phyllosphaerae]|uniref:ATP-dependent Clp protease proteolytic subunit n=1 Tax=Aureimonas phyllosphaerae TaxID=1166078 RepID=A0A7W6BTT4_9HYPH|nr:head maturation protease, ClpP-related [Aureimonas phyllosphaerae]MBB3937926.1 ATP-dependent protease ClpP protease subunit [Aureimonas phyllosphaerae]MBB3961901.1 ATP-dependent protease ClpP protease subunit [Aureimonas phyllosphaerae]SFF54555.1 ATP-dependent protease ClpP, protease subunit [Aureimonas phyllosphaerae]